MINTPQTFEKWWTTFEYHNDALFDQEEMKEAFAAGVASQQAVVDGFRTKVEAFTIDREDLFKQLAEKEAEIERLKDLVEIKSRKCQRAEAVKEAARLIQKNWEAIRRGDLAASQFDFIATQLREALDKSK